MNRCVGGVTEVWFEKIPLQPIVIPEYLLPEIKQKAEQWKQMTKLAPEDSILRTWTETTSNSISSFLQLYIEIVEKESVGD